jgi:hypothetical protein
MSAQKKLATIPSRRISPELKSWIDNCLVPIMVEEYLAQHSGEKSIAAESTPVVTSAATGTLSAGENL